MITNLHRFFGIAAGILTLIGLLVYGRSVVSGPTKPSRATWFIWTLNSFLLLASYDASGAKETVWLAGAYAVGCFAISLLTIKFGEPGWGRLDRACLVGAVLGGLLWWVTGSPLTAYIATLVIDFFGVLPTIQKSWTRPEEEDRLAWVVMFTGAGASLFAIEEWSLVIVWYPLQLTITAAIIVWFIFRLRRT